MPNISPIWLASVGCMAVILAISCYKAGPARALGLSVVLSYLFPLWLKADILGMPLDVRTTTAILGLAVFAMHPRARLFERLTFLDVAVSLLVLSHVATEVSLGGSLLPVFLRAYGEWALPYVVGRYAIGSRNDIGFLAVAMALVACLLGLANIVETFSGFKPFQEVFGLIPFDKFVNNQAARVGWFRAFGTTHHPLFCSVLLLLFLPWTVQFILRHHSTLWRIISPVPIILLLAGQLATVSRGPFLGSLCVPVLAMMAISKRWFWGIFSAGVFVSICLAVNWQDVERWANQLGGEDEKFAQKLEIDGELVPYTSGRARFYVIQIWGPVLKHAGFLGAGTAATSEFPPNVGGVRERLQTVKLLPMVDNAYILHGLRFGWFGMATLIATFLIAIGQFLALREMHGVRTFAIFMAATITIFAALMMIVWLCFDFAFVFLWSIGISSGLLVDQNRFWRPDEIR